MKMSKTEQFRSFFRAALLMILAATCVLYLVALFGPARRGEAPVGSSETQTIADGWTLTKDGTTQNVTLPYAFSEAQGDTGVLRMTLPAEIRTGMQLSFRAAMQNAVIRIDGEERASYRTENYEHMDEKLPSAYVVAELRDEDAGKPLEIEVVSKKNGNGVYNAPVYGYGQNMWLALVRANVPVLLLSILDIVVGLGTLLGCLLLRKKMFNTKAFVSLACLMMVTGLWTISESPLRQLIFNSPSYSSIFAYVLIGILAAFASQYFDEVQNHHYTKMYTAISGIIVLQMVVDGVLYACGVAELYDTLIFSHVWIVVAIVLFLGTVIRDILNKRIREYLYASIGMLILAGCGIGETLSFYFIKRYDFGTWLGVGLILLLAATLIQGFANVIVREEARRNQTIAKTKSTIRTIAKAIDAKDEYTGGHSERVGEYAQLLCGALGYSKEDCQRIHYIGTLHDIGKIGIPDGILNKAGKLSDEEYSLMKSHTVLGSNMLKDIDDVEGLRECVRSHHERYDGTGYPDGLKGGEIPMFARILCVVDCYDAMTTDRPYRKRLPDQAVYAEIQRCSGTQFDPTVAAAMLKLLDEGKISA